VRRLIGILLFVLGGMLWLAIGRAQGIDARIVLPAALVGVVTFALLRTRRAVWTPSPLHRRRVAVAIALLAMPLLLAIALAQGRDPGPRFSDEFSYLLQGRMLLEGTLLRDAHPLADHLETWGILASPAYGSVYFPGFAPLAALVVAMDAPPWLLPLAITAASLAMLHLLIAGLFDDAAGLVAVAFALALPMFRSASLTIYSSVLSLALGLALLLVATRWLEEPRRRLATLAGVLVGWLLLTRPADALAFAAPVLLALATAAAIPCRTRAAHLSLAALVVVPFVVVQLAINHAATGSATRSLFDVYAGRFHPGAQYGVFATRADLSPATTLPHVHAAYETEIRPVVALHQPATLASAWRDRHLPTLADAALPSPWLLGLVPIGLLAMDRRRAMVATTLPAFVAVQVPYAFVLPHYALAIVPATAVLVLAGIEATARRVPTSRTPLRAAAVALAAATSLMMLRQSPDEPVGRDPFVRADRALASIGAPALVLFPPPPPGEWLADPVVNLGSGDVDALPLIRLHDRGEVANAGVFRYYASQDPRRIVYRYDPQTGVARRVATVGELSGLQSRTTREPWQRQTHASSSSAR
jgi:hypothetical protein